MGMGLKFQMGMGMKSLKWEGIGTKNLFLHTPSLNWSYIESTVDMHNHPSQSHPHPASSFDLLIPGSIHAQSLS